MNKYAVIPFDKFNSQEVEGVYSIIDVREKYTLIEYVTEPGPTGEHWVIFEGEDANIKCADYMDTRGRQVQTTR